MLTATPGAQPPVTEPQKVSRTPHRMSAKRSGGRRTRARHTAVHSGDDAPARAPQTEREAIERLERDLALKVGKQRQANDYPEEAVRSGWSGTAVVGVLIAGNGTIKTIALERTSGFKVLDDQALELVRRVSQVWVPVRLRKRDTSVTVPIGFQFQQL